jgi:hypothetical protein
VKTEKQLTDMQPDMLVTNVADTHGGTLRDRAAHLWTGERAEPVAAGGEQESVAAFNASV